MKKLSPLFAVVSALLISFAATARAQDDPTGGDQGAPPPPPQMDQSATGGDQGAPPPPMEQVPPPDQGQQPVDQGQGDDQGVSFQNFYDQLGDQGTWVQTDNYGYVFQPRVSDPNWAPYSDGRWVYTDDGWTWVSDESWGWATYHYGRWCNIDGTGWCWVPGYRWAPAWVSWRYGGGYCGWAPLPPETFVGAEYGYGGGVNVGVGFHFGGDVDVSFNIGPGCYNFVPVGYMGERNYRGRYVDRSRNYVIINNTTNITNINIGGRGRERNFRGVSAYGPPLAQINAHSREHIQNVRLTEASRAGHGQLQGNSLAVYAPRVNAASAHQARPGRIAQTVNSPRLNRGDSISQPLAVNSNVRPNAPSAEAIQAAQAARQHAPASAKIANEQTPVRTHLDRPLTSMQPVGEEHHSRNAETTGGGGINQTAAPSSAQHAPAVTPQTHVQQHSTAESAETGAPKQTPAYHPQTQVAPTPTYHQQQQNQVAPTPTYHQQQQNQVAPTPTYHQQQQNQVAPMPTYHQQQSQVAPSETHHSQNQVAPSQTYHQQQSESGGNHQSAPPAPTYHPQPQPAPAQQHQSAPAPAQQQQRAPAQQQAPAGGNKNNNPNGNQQNNGQQH